MSTRGVCTAEGGGGGESARLRCLHNSKSIATSNGHTNNGTKIRRTRKAPDFYSPETPPSKTEVKSKKVESDENDSWKPESESDDVESDSESAKSSVRHKTGTTRRRAMSQKSPSHEYQETNGEAKMTESMVIDKELKEDVCESQDEEKVEKLKKEETKQKEKKMKGVRELQNLLDGHAQVHKGSRSRGLLSRRDRRAASLNGNSESTWSNASSRAAVEKESTVVDASIEMKQSPDEEEEGEHDEEEEEEDEEEEEAKGETEILKNNTRSQKTPTSSTENGLMTMVSGSLDEEEGQGDRDHGISPAKRLSSFQNGSSSKSKSSEVINGTVSNGGMRVKRQRVDVESTTQTQIADTAKENDGTGGDSGDDDEEEDMSGAKRRQDSSVLVAQKREFKLPRMPMIKYGDYWYRARIKKEEGESIFVEFTGFEDGTLKPFWIRKDSESVFKGSYSGKDWKHLGDGAWEPKPRKVIPKKCSRRRYKKARKKHGLASVAESIGPIQTSRIEDRRDHNHRRHHRHHQMYTADSEVECTKSASPILARENGQISNTVDGHHATNGGHSIDIHEHQSRYRDNDNNSHYQHHHHEVKKAVSADCIHLAMSSGRGGGSSSDGGNGVGGVATNGEKSLEDQQEGSHHSGNLPTMKDVPSMESFPENDSDRQRMSHGSRLHGHERKGEDHSPTSRNHGSAGVSGASQVDGFQEKESKKEMRQTSNSRHRHHHHHHHQGKDLSSNPRGMDANEEKITQTRCRRKPGRLPSNRRIGLVDEPNSNRRPNEQLRRSARLEWKTPWKGSFKDDSSSEAECDDESPTQANNHTNTNSRRHMSNSRNGTSKYLTRSSHHSEIGGGGGVQRSGSLPSQSRRSICPTMRTSRSKRIRKNSGRSVVGSKEDPYEYDDELAYEMEHQHVSEDMHFHRNGSSLKTNIHQQSLIDNGRNGHGLNTEVNVFAQLRKYLPYYNDHIDDPRLPSFVELMERLDAVRVKEIALSTPTTTTTTNSCVDTMHQKSKDCGVTVGNVHEGQQQVDHVHDMNVLVPLSASPLEIQPTHLP